MNWVLERKGKYGQQWRTPGGGYTADIEFARRYEVEPTVSEDDALAGFYVVEVPE
jgi:hypothetical protein